MFFLLLVPFSWYCCLCLLSACRPPPAPPAPSASLHRAAGRLPVWWAASASAYDAYHAWSYSCTRRSDVRCTHSSCAGLLQQEREEASCGGVLFCSLCIPLIVYLMGEESHLHPPGVQASFIMVRVSYHLVKSGTTRVGRRNQGLCDEFDIIIWSAEYHDISLRKLPYSREYRRYWITNTDYYFGTNTYSTIVYSALPLGRIARTIVVTVSGYSDRVLSADQNTLQSTELNRSESKLKRNIFKKNFKNFRTLGTEKEIS